jgi:hypothetical protein
MAATTPTTTTPPSTPTIYGPLNIDYLNGEFNESERFFSCPFFESISNFLIIKVSRAISAISISRSNSESKGKKSYHGS